MSFNLCWNLQWNINNFNYIKWLKNLRTKVILIRKQVKKSGDWIHQIGEHQEGKLLVKSSMLFQKQLVCSPMNSWEAPNLIKLEVIVLWLMIYFFVSRYLNNDGEWLKRASFESKGKKILLCVKKMLIDPFTSLEDFLMKIIPLKSIVSLIHLESNDINQNDVFKIPWKKESCKIIMMSGSMSEEQHYVAYVIGHFMAMYVLILCVKVTESVVYTIIYVKWLILTHTNWG